MLAAVNMTQIDNNYMMIMTMSSVTILATLLDDSTLIDSLQGLSFIFVSDSPISPLLLLTRSLSLSLYLSDSICSRALRLRVQAYTDVCIETPFVTNDDRLWYMRSVCAI